MESVTGELITKLTDVQQSSDRLMIELEEKRLKLEEKQMEREAQLRREERDFQLQMMRMMMGQFWGAPPGPPPHMNMGSSSGGHGYGAIDHAPMPHFPDPTSIPTTTPCRKWWWVELEYLPPYYVLSILLIIVGFNKNYYNYNRIRFTTSKQNQI